MMKGNPHRNRRRMRLRASAWILVVPALMVVGCAGHDDGNDTTVPPTSTATIAVPATATRPPAMTPTATGVADTPTTAPHTPTPTPTMVNDSAAAACQKLMGCNQCFSNSLGTCIETAACAQRIGTDVAVCINGTTGCNPDSLGNCLFPGCDGNDASAECQ